MARIEYAPRAFVDFERLVDFLLESDTGAAAEAFHLIESAILVLADHPLIGRPIDHGFRELVISRGRTGYLALYRYDEREDRVLVLALRHQREAGYV